MMRQMNRSFPEASPRVSPSLPFILDESFRPDHHLMCLRVKHARWATCHDYVVTLFFVTSPTPTPWAPILGPDGPTELSVGRSSALCTAGLSLAGPPNPPSSGSVCSGAAILGRIVSSPPFLDRACPKARSLRKRSKIWSSSSQDVSSSTSSHSTSASWIVLP